MASLFAVGLRFNSHCWNLASYSKKRKLTSLVLARFQSNASMEMDLPRFGPQQLTWTCGVISATRLLNAYGHNVSLDQMIKEIGRLKILDRDVDVGNTPAVIAERMLKYDHDTKDGYFLTFKFVKKLLAEGKPVATLLHLGESNNNPWDFPVPLLHWVVLSGFNDQTQKVTMYRPEYSHPTSMSYRDFANQWKWNHWDAFRGSDTVGDSVKSLVYGTVDKILGRNTIFWIDKPGSSIPKREENLSEILHSNPPRYLPAVNFEFGGEGVTDCGFNRAYGEAKDKALKRLNVMEDDLFLDLAYMTKNFHDRRWRENWPVGARKCEFSIKVLAYSTKPEF